MGETVAVGDGTVGLQAIPGLHLDGTVIVGILGLDVYKRQLPLGGTTRGSHTGF